jgi:hypothetical protein
LSKNNPSVPGVGVEPTRTGSKPASLPLADPGMRRRKERESNPQGLRSAVFGTAAIARWLALPFSLDGWIRTSVLRLPKPADETRLSYIQISEWDPRDLNPHLAG